MKRTEILSSAIKCVSSDRNTQYGEPENNFKVIAALWEAYVKEKCASSESDVCICADDVAAMMILFKVGRLSTAENQSADTWIDIAGYAACGGEISTKGEETFKF